MESKPKVWINNKIIPWEDAQAPILSHALSRGSAIFEVFGLHEVTNDVMAFRMDKHLQRLQQTAKLLDMQLKYTSQEITDGVIALANENKPGRSLVKIMAYWSEEAIIDLVLKSKLDIGIFIIPSAEELHLDQTDSLSACFSKWNKLHPDTIPVEAKASANYLSAYLIRKDAIDRGYDLGIAVGTDGLVAEGSIESLFIVKNGVLKTPATSGKILKSVTRDSLLILARDAGIAVEETDLQKQDIFSADEIFTCHTGTKIVPIKQFEDKKLSAPGAITTQLTQIMAGVLANDNKQYSHWFKPITTL